MKSKRNNIVMVGLLAALSSTPPVHAATLEELSAQIERLQAEVEYLKESTRAERKEAAQEDVELEAIKTSVATANKLSWKGDLRYRHEQIDAEEATAVRTRQRLRARFGFTAKINNTLTGVVQLATDGGSSDPRSPNQDLGNGWTRKPLAIDLAYAEWKPLTSTTVQLGKMPMPWVRTGSFFFDGDITPEGVAVKYSKGALFASTFGYWLSERAADVDSQLLGGQVGIKRAAGPVTLTGALSYFDLKKVQGQITTTATGCTANPAFFGGPQGNTTYLAGGCARLLNDFNDVQALVQADFAIDTLPVSVFADYVRNTEADALDSAWAAGVTLGRAGNARTWEVGYVYQVAEKDSVFGQFHDSDFNGNLLDGKGHAFKAAYVPATNWTLNGAYYVNKRFMDVGTSRDYTRLMLDLNYKF